MANLKCLMFAAGVEAFMATLAVTEAVFDDSRKIALCVIGSIIGAFLTIAVFPPDTGQDKNNLRRLALKFGVSSAGAIGFAPAIIEYFNLSRTSDMLVGIAAFTAVFVVSAIHLIAPRFEKLIIKWFKIE